ncbi:MAG: hypothetical protein H6810_02920 [Phycisphaeraceae bacterium]|nr:MAG: hypothetical protein H6810_02920 [Phycisphaeraceae bacterium]
MAGQQPSTREAQGAGSRWAGAAGYLIGPAFLLIALLILALPGAAIPIQQTPAVDRASISIAPRRTPLGDPPVAVVNGMAHRCNDCHGIFESRENSQADLRQHTDIKLEHGLNNNCYNCHDRKDREKLALHDGSTTTFTHSEMLCAQCHGRMYRDWSRGAHGKTMGAWDPANPGFHRLTCVQCHNPHAPMFDPIEPLPAPHTLRMGDPGHGHHAEIQKKRNPLLQWSEPGGHE